MVTTVRIRKLVRKQKWTVVRITTNSFAPVLRWVVETFPHGTYKASIAHRAHPNEGNAYNIAFKNESDAAFARLKWVI